MVDISTMGKLSMKVVAQINMYGKWLCLIIFVEWLVAFVNNNQQWLICDDWWSNGSKIQMPNDWLVAAAYRMVDLKI